MKSDCVPFRAKKVQNIAKWVLWPRKSFLWLQEPALFYNTLPFFIDMMLKSTDGSWKNKKKHGFSQEKLIFKS